MDIRSICLILSVCLIWGAFAPAVKIGFQGIPPFYSGGLRFLISLLILFAWSKIKRIPLPKTDLRPLIITGIISGVQIPFAYLGILHSSASHSAILINIQPFVVTILAHFYLSNEKEVVTLGKFVGLTLGLLGVIALFEGRIEPLLFKGDVYNLISAFFWGINTIYIKKEVTHKFDPLVIVLWQIAFSSLCFLILGGLFERDMNFSFSLPVILAITYLSLLCTAFGFVAWTYLLKENPADKVSSFTFTVPGFGVIASWIMLGETIDLKIILGALLIGIGIWRVTRG